MPSSPKPTTPTEIWVTESDLKTALSAIANQLPRPTWTFAQQLYNSAALCATQPPAPPVITDGDILLAQSNPISWLALMDKVGKWRDAWAFSQYCQITGTGTHCFGPVNRSYAIGGTIDPIVATPGQIGVAGDTWTIHWDSASINGGSGPNGKAKVRCYIDGGYNNFYDVQTPYGTTNQTIPNLLMGTTGTTHHYGFSIWTDDNSYGMSYTNLYLDMPSCSGGSTTTAPPPDVPNLPNTPVLPTPTGCTTDDLCGRLDEILWILQHSDHNQTQVITTQNPTQYARGASHAVSGSGFVSVPQLIALSVSMSGIPPYTGSQPTSPTTVYSGAHIALGGSDGYQERIPLRHNPQVVDCPSWVRSIGFDFPAGVSATLLELVPVT